MRTTDPDPVARPILGEKVVKSPTPAPVLKPQGPSGIVTDKDGRISTTSHKPYIGRMTLEEAIWNWREVYAEEGRVDFLP